MKRGRKPKPWTKSELALLGTMVDREVGKRIGVSDIVVRIRRVQLGIAPHRKHAHCKVPAYLKFLGKVSDAAIARQYSVTRECVRQYRVKYGIAKPSLNQLLGQRFGRAQVVSVNHSMAQLHCRCGVEFSLATSTVYDQQLRRSSQLACSKCRR